MRSSDLDEWYDPIYFPMSIVQSCPHIFYGLPMLSSDLVYLIIHGVFTNFTDFLLESSLLLAFQSTNINLDSVLIHQLSWPTISPKKVNTGWWFYPIYIIYTTRWSPLFQGWNQPEAMTFVRRRKEPWRKRRPPWWTSCRLMVDDYAMSWSHMKSHETTNHGVQTVVDVGINCHF